MVKIKEKRKNADYCKEIDKNHPDVDQWGSLQERKINTVLDEIVKKVSNKTA